MASVRRQAASDLRQKLELERIFRPEVERVSRSVARQFTRGASPPAVGQRHADQIEPVLRRQYARAQKAFEGNLGDRLPRDVRPTPEEEAVVAAVLIAEFDDRAAIQARIIGETTAKEARRAAEIANEEVVRMRQEGEDVGTRDELVIAGALLARRFRGRSQTIVSHETNASVERSKLVEVWNLVDFTRGVSSSFRATPEPSVEITKEWVSQADNLVRSHHLSADGQKVASDQPFIVLNQRLMSPGDTSLGATAINVAGCRCGAVFDDGRVTLARRRAASEDQDFDQSRDPVDAAQLPNEEAKISADKWTGSNGQLLPERAQLHDDILDDFVEGAVPKPQKTLHLVGGGPASGKGTVIRTGQVDLPTRAVVIDADAIKGKLPEFQLASDAKVATGAAFVHKESSQISEKLLRRSQRDGLDTVLDGTGDGGIEKLAGRVQPFKDAGYRVKADYVTVPTDVAVDRAFQRGLDTGRFVPESITREIHAGVSKVFPQAVRADLFDEVRLFDTDIPLGGTPGLIFSKIDGVETIHDQLKWDAFLAKADEVF